MKLTNNVLISIESIRLLGLGQEDLNLRPHETIHEYANLSCNRLFSLILNEFLYQFSFAKYLDDFL